MLNLVELIIKSIKLMEKQTYQGNWKCSKCGKNIKELPFNPKSTENLICRECYSKSGGIKPKKQMFHGDWKCSKCGGKITELPFEPKSTKNLVCRDCYLKNR